MLVTVDRGETRVAILEAEGETAAATKETEAPKGRSRRGRGRGKPPQDWRVGELYVERRGNRSIVGNVYKGRVDNVLPGLEAAFVDVGLDKNGFLHADDIVMPGVEIARRGRGGGKGKRIGELLKHFRCKVTAPGITPKLGKTRVIDRHDGDIVRDCQRTSNPCEPVPFI